MKPSHSKRGITPEKAQAILAEMGITISASEAAMVLDFMYFFANLEMDDFNKRK